MYIVDVLVNCAEGSGPVHGSRQQPRLVPPAPEVGVPLVVAFPLEQACGTRTAVESRQSKCTFAPGQRPWCRHKINR